MSAIVTNNFRIKDANTFIESVNTNSIYMYIGKISPWPDDFAPPLPVDTVAETTYNEWNDMIAAKLVTSFDAVNMIPRNDWVSGTQYAQYDPTNSDLVRSNFHVTTSTFKIYKVIDNNGGAASTEEPTSTSSSVFSTSDGYIWKYMYSVLPADAAKFISADFVPIRNISGNADTALVGLLPIPRNGHGANNIRELGAYFVATNIKFEGNEGGEFTTANDFRKVGLVLDPYLKGTTTVATDLAYRQTTKLTLTGTSGIFAGDETVIGATGGDVAKVVEYDSGTGNLYIKIVSGTFAVTNGVSASASGASGTISAVDEESLEPYSGDVLYVENRTPVTRNISQTESVTVILQF